MQSKARKKETIGVKIVVDLEFMKAAVSFCLGSCAAAATTVVVAEF
jgi:hypothetical protein